MEKLILYTNYFIYVACASSQEKSKYRVNLDINLIKYLLIIKWFSA